jgi:hypothetical protein
MKSPTQPNLQQDCVSICRLILIMLLMSTLLAPHVRAADANDSFQYNALFSPNPAQLKAEARGRVMIYDGLDNTVVERALDEQFDRIERMMFVRTRQSTPDDDDETIVEDDGC